MDPASTEQFDLGARVLVSSGSTGPGDFSLFAEPDGHGGRVRSLVAEANPVIQAPNYTGKGGVVYFDQMSLPDLEAVCRVLGIEPYGTQVPCRRYAVYTQVSSQGRDNYLVQMRLVSRFALRFLFGTITAAEYEEIPEQPLTMPQALWEFIAFHRQRWGTNFWHDTKGLAGMFGGDGELERESLSFALLVENDYYNVYRIWSRGYLVTK